MITTTRIEEFRAHEAVGWISALHTEVIESLVYTGTLQLLICDEQHIAEITSIAFSGECLIAYFNLFLPADCACTRSR